MLRAVGWGVFGRVEEREMGGGGGDGGKVGCEEFGDGGGLWGV